MPARPPRRRPFAPLLADIARQTGADLEAVRATAARYFADYPFIYSPALDAVAELGRDTLMAEFTDDEPDV